MIFMFQEHIMMKIILNDHFENVMYRSALGGIVELKILNTNNKIGDFNQSEVYSVKL